MIKAEVRSRVVQGVEERDSDSRLISDWGCDQAVAGLTRGDLPRESGKGFEFIFDTHVPLR